MMIPSSTASPFVNVLLLFIVIFLVCNAISQFHTITITNDNDVRLVTSIICGIASVGFIVAILVTMLT
jgi:hypothetical protein